MDNVCNDEDESLQEVSVVAGFTVKSYVEAVVRLEAVMKKLSSRHNSVTLNDKWLS